MKKVLYYLLLAVLIGVFAFSAYKIGSYLVEKHKSEQVTKAAEEFTTPSRRTRSRRRRSRSAFPSISTPCASRTATWWRGSTARTRG